MRSRTRCASSASRSVALLEVVEQRGDPARQPAMARAVEGREARHGRAVEIGAGRGDDAGGEGRGVEFVVGRQHQRGAHQRRALGRHLPGRGELLVDGQRRERPRRHRRGQQAQHAHAGLQHRARGPRPSSDDRSAAAAGSSDEAAIDRRQGGRGQPGAAQRGGHRRQVVGGERPLVAVPQQARHLLERGGARQRGRHRGRDNKVGRSRSGSATIRAPACRNRARGWRSTSALRPTSRRRFSRDDVVGAVAPLAPAVDGLRAQQAAAHIGVERGRRHAQPPRRFRVNSAIHSPCHYIDQYNQD